MRKNKKITVQGVDIGVYSLNQDDFICLTDIAKGKEGEDHIRNWMRNRNTVEFLGLWESLNNPDFKGVGFDTFRKEAGLNAFNMTPKKWIEGTNAIGIISKSGRYGGTYAHKDIAFEFATWLSPVFKLWLLKEFQRLKELENSQYNIEWDVKRILTKVNYRIHTDAIQDHIIPQSRYSKEKHWIEYANEADLLNVALFNITAKDWKETNPQLAIKGHNVRDIASINELTVLSNLESINAEMIKSGVSKHLRFERLKKMAKDQLDSIKHIDIMKSIRKQNPDSFIEAPIIKDDKSTFNKSLDKALKYNPKEKS